MKTIRFLIPYSFLPLPRKYPLRSKGIFLCSGTVTEELGYLSLNVQWLERLETAADPRKARGYKQVS